MTHFSDDEFDNVENMDPMLGRMLDYMRTAYGGPITITSSYRAHTDPRTSAHEIDARGIWQAVDIRVSSSRARFGLVGAALKAGFRRIGVYDKHIHVDIAEEPFGQDVMWFGVSS